MADSENTPSKSKSRPPAPQRTNSDQSEDQGYESRSRSASRRRRRQNQRQKGQGQGKAQAGKAKAQSMAAVQEQEEPEEEEVDEEVQQGYAPKSQWLKNPEPRDTTETQPFDWIKPASQGMMGPVTYAKMMRGEIPWRGPPPRQPYETTQGVDAKTNAPDPMEQDGLKLRIELNLDIEIELKAHIHGDLTLALLLRSPSDYTRVLDTGALLLYFPAPNSVTGEDVLELHVHGGPAIVRSILEALPECSGPEKNVIRAAAAGEFTKRAFYNGRIDLTEVEALGEALAAETEQQRRLAVSGAASALTQRYGQWRSMLLYARGELEALIDFSEDQHFDESPAEFMSSVSKQVLDLKSQLELHILNSGRGELLRSGINVALLGAPNAGKSSLLNRIVGREAAIVSAEEGTTRDIVDVNIDLQGWLVRLGDMAGLRSDHTDTAAAVQAGKPSTFPANVNIGEIEREGMRRARERALQSDLILVLISLQETPEGTVGLAINEELVSAVRQCRTSRKDMLFVVNKIDLLQSQTARHKVSISRLLSSLIDTFPDTDPNEVFCISCKDADLFVPDESDAGGLQTFIAGLVQKLSSMTAAVASLPNSDTTQMSAADAQSYWAASLNVTHHQGQALRQCLTHLQDFLSISLPNAHSHPLVEASAQVVTGPGESSHGGEYFDTTEMLQTERKPQHQDYHIDNHEDIVGQIEDIREQFHTSEAMRQSHKHLQNPHFHAENAELSENIDLDGEFDVVTAAEHLRHAANCLAKLIGRGDGLSSGADVEDVLGVVFEK
ncbi:mitochondrial splicing system protein [Lithohypha guttulata]|nr:mitochondrial splicing system protein [Lithohypha guttulata]